MADKLNAELKSIERGLRGSPGHHSSFECWTCKQRKSPLGRKKHKKTGMWECKGCAG